MTHDPAPLGDAADVLSPRRAMLAGLGGLAAGAFLASTANAGPLNPPPGPISPTPGPEPRIPINQTNTPGTAGAVFRITQAGSYYLTENLQVPSGLVGIEIAMSDVTIDLNGFRIAGFLGQSSDGIVVASGIARRNITIRNGSIVTCGGAGINLTSSSHNAVEHIHVRGNTGDGIRTGDSTRVTDCSALDSGGSGIFTGDNAMVQNCIAQGSGVSGIRAGQSCAVSQCIAEGNSGIGISLGLRGIATECTARNNGNDGVSAGASAVVTGCNASSNGFDGIAVTGNGVVQECVCSSNQTGIRAGACCTITKCTASVNANFGINVMEWCLVSQNSCCGTQGSPGTGIRLTGRYNRIEENNSVLNNIGISCAFPNNFIARNTCSNNTTNWDIAANNKCLVINGNNAPAINGNSGGVSPGSTDPNANYTY